MRTHIRWVIRPPSTLQKYHVIEGLLVNAIHDKIKSWSSCSPSLECALTVEHLQFSVGYCPSKIMLMLTQPWYQDCVRLVDVMIVTMETCDCFWELSMCQSCWRCFWHGDKRLNILPQKCGSSSHAVAWNCVTKSCVCRKRWDWELSPTSGLDPLQVELLLLHVSITVMHLSVSCAQWLVEKRLDRLIEGHCHPGRPRHCRSSSSKVCGAHGGAEIPRYKESRCSVPRSERKEGEPIECEPQRPRGCPCS